MHRTGGLALLGLVGVTALASGQGRPSTPWAAADSTVLELLRPYDGRQRPGIAVAIVRGGGVFTAAVGMADIERGKAMRSSTVVDVASVSKQFTAFAIATLEAEGLLRASDPVARHIPALGFLGDTVTVEHLVHHTSGINDYQGLAALAGRHLEDAMTPDELVQLIVAEGTLRHAPGEHFIYTNSGYLLLGLVIAAIAGEPPATWLRRRVFVPVGMQSTSIPSDQVPARAGIATPYVPDGPNGYRPARRLPHVAGPGGVHSTAEDLARWAQVLLAGRFGGAAVHERITQTVRLTDGSAVPYAYGLETGSYRGVRRLSHSGSAPGIHSQFAVYPDQGVAVIILSNGADPSNVAQRIADLYLGDALGEETGETALPAGAVFVDSRRPDPPEESFGVAGDSARYLAFAGRYRLAEGPDLVITTEDGRLFLSIDLETPPVELFPVPGNRYRFVPASWDLTFESAGDGEWRLGLHLSERSVRRGPPRTLYGVRVTVAPPSPEELATFAGCFHHSGLNTTYQVVARDGRLTLVHRAYGVMRLVHLRDDVYAVDDARASGLSRVEFLHRVARDLTSPVVGVRIRAIARGVSADFSRCGSR